MTWKFAFPVLTPDFWIPMPCVLIVDDEKQIRRVLRLLLEEQGYTVAEAASGEEAVRLLEGAPADAVLLDLRLPGVDGLERLVRLEAPMVIHGEGWRGKESLARVTL
jgi:CheY-like chemotaxis protein